MDLGTDLLNLVKFLAGLYVTIEGVFTAYRVLNRGVQEAG